jgi:hypothetical protein
MPLTAFREDNWLPERHGGGDAMITDQKQLETALNQLASFKGMLEAMRLHLQDTEPSLIPTVSESYEHRIQELQEEICDYLLRDRNEHADTGQLTAGANG